ncbi:sulfurtransferase [Psychrilyobacter atlanticus]|uniref:sulfurtransferase n=1 Tax=Psychrilyobacter atlanticus TaxID=271091 RepID=UPI00041987F3|nr:rhodanese-like domain-containing protein [Psychrilyobacter atlanticus]
MRKKLILGIFLLMGVLSFCESFVSTEWLSQNKNNIKIIDARGKAYKLGHIPGSIEVSWKSLSDMDAEFGSEKWGTVLEFNDLSKRLNELGIKSTDEIVIYSKTHGAWGEDGRIYWTLQMAGFKNLHILDGGIEKWKNEGRKTTFSKTKYPEVTNSIVKLDNSRVITTDQLIKEFNDLVIIDTREEDEYLGATKFGEARGGHIEGAINIPFNSFLEKNGALKNTKEIKKILESNGIENTAKIVTYCTAGIRSAHMQVVLEKLGYDARNYDASFYRWAALKTLKLEK